MQHLLDALFRHEDAVLDGINTATHCVQNALGPLGMARAGFVKSVSFGDAGGHFFGRVVGVFRVHTGGHNTTGGHDFHQIRACVHLLADRFHHVVDAVRDTPETVAVSAGHADHAA